MADTYLKPLPIPSAESAPYWEYCKKGELRIQRCASCGAFVHYPRAVSYTHLTLPTKRIV